MCIAVGWVQRNDTHLVESRENVDGAAIFCHRDTRSVDPELADGYRFAPSILLGADHRQLAAIDQPLEIARHYVEYVVSHCFY